MNVLIVGCGKTGAHLASVLSRMGHDVSIVSKSDDEHELLSEDFDGMAISGVLIDRDVLRKAGIERCDALAAVSEEDNINIMVSQVAKELFGIKKVVTRIFDPLRKNVYSYLGLETISPVNITVATMCSLLLSEQNVQLTFGTDTVTFIKRTVTENNIGIRLGAVKCENKFENLFGCEKSDGSFKLFSSDSKEKIEEGDVLIFARKID